MKKSIFLLLASIFYLSSSYGQQLESITPNSVLLGECSYFTVELSATGTNFSQATDMSMEFNNVVSNNTTYGFLDQVIDGENIIMSVNKENFQDCGDFDVILYSNENGVLTLPSAFTIPCPELVSFTPNQGNLGENLSVEIGMNNVDFGTGSGFVWMSQGTNTINLNPQFDSPTSFSSSVDIPIDANCGNYNLVIGCGGFFGGNPWFNIPDAFEVACDGTVGGTVYNDENGNGIQDGNETGMEHVTILIQPGDIQLSTGNDGSYNLPLGEGTYTVSVVPPNYYEQSSVPTEYTIVVVEGENNVVNNFGLNAPVPVTDVSVELTGSTPVAGFETNYWINFKNLGTTTESGTITLILDPNMNLEFSTITPTDIALNTITWDYTDLEPFEERSINLLCQIEVLPPGNFLSLNIDITPYDNVADQSNNSDVLNEEILTSYDPNDKAVTPAGVQDEHYTLIADAEFEYKIRFQNTGTYPAQNIRIEDMLSSDLDPSTFNLIAASHEVEYTIREQLLEFNFFNVELPDSTNNEPESHGFVKFSIRPYAGISENTVINNTASIYFDFNPAVETNTVSNTMVNVIPVSTDNPTLNKVAVKVYPNPVDVMATFEVQDAKYKDNLEFRLYDALGRLVQNRKVDANFTVERESLKSGLYFYKIDSNGETINTGRLVFR